MTRTTSIAAAAARDRVRLGLVLPVESVDASPTGTTSRSRVPSGGIPIHGRDDAGTHAAVRMLTMRAWRVERPGPVGTGPLSLRDEPDPEPGAGELLVRVLACGVCRTDLHVAEG